MFQDSLYQSDTLDTLAYVDNAYFMAHNLPQWTLADRLRKIRRDRHLTQEEVAAALDIKPVTWSAWEAGRTRPHDVVELATRIELTYGVPAAWTLGVLSPPNATNPIGIPVQRAPGQNHGRRWDDMHFAAAVL